MFTSDDKTLAYIRQQLTDRIGAREDMPAQLVEETVDQAMFAYGVASSAFQTIPLRLPTPASTIAAIEAARDLLDAELAQILEQGQAAIVDPVVRALPQRPNLHSNDDHTRGLAPVAADAPVALAPVAVLFKDQTKVEHHQ